MLLRPHVCEVLGLGGSGRVIEEREKAPVPVTTTEQQRRVHLCIGRAVGMLC